MACHSKFVAFTLSCIIATISFATSGYAGDALHTGTVPTQPYSKQCLIIQGSLEPGTTQKIKQAQSNDQQENLCLEFSGGNAKEAFKLVDYVLSRPFATYVRPNKKCGDLCSIVLLAGGTLEEGHWRDVSISKTSVVTYRRLEPDFNAIDVSNAENILDLIHFIDVETEFLNHTFFDDWTFGDVENARVLPTTLLKKIKELKGDAVFRMPVVVKSDDNFTRMNEYGIKIY